MEAQIKGEGRKSIPSPNSFAVVLKGIVKKFPGVIANRGVNFDLKFGEVHALLGENGAGKTTLVNVLYGLYQPDAGEIWVKGKKEEISSPAKALSLGIGMVQQNFTLVPSFSVVENIALGLKGVSSKEVASRLKEISQVYGLSIDPNAKVWQLSVGEMQKVEILKLLVRDVDILILDEPTAVLTPQEVEALFSMLSKFKEEGKAIIFISHKLNEVMRISDRVTVMRKGLVVDTVDKQKTSPPELAKMMVGREVLFKVKKRLKSFGDVVFQVEGLEAYNDKGVKALKGVSFSIRQGEILGIAGVTGNGQRELAEVLVGLRKASSGKVILDGEDITNKGARVFIDKGGSFIPEDRIKHGIAPNLTVIENLFLKSYRRPYFSRKFFLNLERMEEVADSLIEKYDIKVTDKNAPAKLLSGGNLQRLILARELEGKVKLLIAFHPTWGLDVGATEFVYEKILDVASAGAAVLLLAGDLDEIFDLSDRVKVIYEGKLYGDFPPKEECIYEIGMLMAGLGEKEG
ncbi:MAG: ABC transporter ATP-binding protein [Synergistetes bacterium]|nr:ABC transporter ATP-binding protein [Synergistota bacterium]MCX8127663.1 ABC transporter ATP-binding protein [Synergistota bacterium]MDW8191422.1 ABC transporter ATP-binding protein [Synergistota bacterium]